MTRRAAVVIAAYALLAVIVIPVYPHFVSPNEFTRWATAAAIIDLHTLEVTRFVPLFGGDFEDLSEVHGHFYSNKAPGGALVGLPGYAIARAVVGVPSPQTMRITLTAMRLVSSTLPALLLAIVFFYTARALGAERSETALLALLFGTPLFAYGLLNFSHALTAMALFSAWVRLFVRGSARDDVLAGVLIGIAVLSEYPAAIPAAVLVACAIGSRSVARIVAGGLPFAIALAIYNRLLFGSFFSLSSGFESDAAFRRLAGSGLFGIGLPDPLILLRLLIDPARGLFVFSPILLLGLAAFPEVRRRFSARQLWSLLLVPAAMILMYAGYPNWHGGWTMGARYLVPALPFLALPIAFGRSSVLGSLLIGASVLAVAMTTLVFPFVPPNVPAPWATFAWPILRHGLVAPNLLHLVARWLAVAVPFAIVAAAVVFASEKRALVLAGAALWMAAALAVRPTPTVIIERAFVEEVHFERPGAITKATPAGMTVSPSLIERAAVARNLPPTSWPF